MSEELADLQASRDEEIRRLTELFRTGCRPPALKSQPNLQERLSVSNERTSQTHWKRTRNSSCVPRSIESMEIVFADRCEERSNLEEVGCAQRAKRMRRNTKTGLQEDPGEDDEQEDPVMKGLRDDVARGFDDGWSQRSRTVTVDTALVCSTE